MRAPSFVCIPSITQSIFQEDARPNAQLAAISVQTCPRARPHATMAALATPGSTARERTAKPAQQERLLPTAARAHARHATPAAAGNTAFTVAGPALAPVLIARRVQPVSSELGAAISTQARVQTALPSTSVPLVRACVSLCVCVCVCVCAYLSVSVCVCVSLSLSLSLSLPLFFSLSTFVNQNARITHSPPLLVVFCLFAAGWICFCSTFKPLQGTEQCTPCGPCEEGFTRVGCGGKSPGQCTGITCSAAPSVLHAVVQVSNSGVFPSSATYTCAAGYELASGSNNRLTCNTDGGWDGSIPQCVGVPCPQLTIDAGTVKPSTQVRYPDTATFSCSPGFVLQGQSTLQCRADKTWSDSVPTCIGRPCTALEAPGDGEVNFSNNGRYPSTATYTCSTGYELHGGDETRECMAGTGTFDGTAPTCRGVQCDDLPGPDNGQVRLSATPARYPATAEFFCSPGYELVGDVAASCQTDGTWSNAAPVCRGVSCTAPTIANAAVDATSERFPAEATVTCAEGFGLVGTSTITCGVDGTWATLPSCVECAINTFAESPTQPCQPCPSGTSTNNEKGASSCECLPGHEPSAAADDDGVCVPCSDNFFKADWGNGNCEACQDGYVTENGDFTTCVGTLCQALPEVWCRVCVYVCACVCVCVCAASFSNSQVLCLFKRAFSLSLFTD